MEIQFNAHLDPVARAASSRSKARPAAAPPGGVEFTGTQALDKALHGTPAARAEVVARARDLVSNSSYPPPETIRRIANLLAAHLDRPAE